MEEPINYNSLDLSSDMRFLYLMQGKRIPQNNSELEFLEEVAEIQAKGGVVEIPHSDMI